MRLLFLIWNKCSSLKINLMFLCLLDISCCLLHYSDTFDRLSGSYLYVGKLLNTNSLKLLSILRRWAPYSILLLLVKCKKIMSEYKYSFQGNSKKTLKEKLYHHTPKDLVTRTMDKIFWKNSKIVCNM